MAFGKQFADVVEWTDFTEDVIFWKWQNAEIKKGSRLIIHPGQDAIFLYNGKIEGIFCDEGSFDIESQIIPFLSSLKGFKFGFNSGLRAEVLFVNTKEITVRWGTKNAIMIPTERLPGGMPIRAFGTFCCQASDYTALIDQVAGVRNVFTIADVKERVISKLDQLLMKWIAQEGKDIFHLQAFAEEISRGIGQDLDYDMSKIGIKITNFVISNVSYPEEVQEMAETAAAQSMVGDMGTYQQFAMADALSSGDGSAGNAAGSMAGIGVGMAMGQQMANQFASGAQGAQNAQPPAGNISPKFCPQCGTANTGTKFCPNCGAKLSFD